MKNTKVELVDRIDHDRITITLPNGAEIIITTSKKFNEIHLMHNRFDDEKMVIKPSMGNTLDVICTDINY